MLAVAYSNVASLLLARVAERRAEWGVRAALGAARGRLLREALLESVLIAASSGMLSILLSYWGIHLLGSLLPVERMPAWVRPGIDGRVFAFAIGVGLITVAGIGLWPALEASRVDPVSVIKAGDTHAVAGGRHARQGRIAIMLELALATTLLVVVLLLVRTYIKVSAVDVGFDASRVLEAVIRLPEGNQIPPARQEELYEQVVSYLTATPDVEAVALRGEYAGPEPGIGRADSGLTRGDGIERGDKESDTPRFGIYQPKAPSRSAVRGLYPFPTIWVVSPDFFRVLGLRIVRGRSFGVGDRPGAPPVAIVSERLAHHLWPGDDPIGHTLVFEKDGAPVTIIGVASNIRQPTFGRRGFAVDVLPDVYVPAQQALVSAPELLVRPRVVSRASSAMIGAAVHSVAPTAAVERIEWVSDHFARAVVLLRPLGAMIAAFAAGTLCLAVVGIYGVISYSVVRRTREIGIRAALGASPSAIIRLVMRDGTGVMVRGLIIGLSGAVLLSTALRRVFWGVSSLDTISYGAATLLLGIVGLIACYVPARRATRVPAASALRQL